MGAHLVVCGRGYGVHVIAVPERRWEISIRHRAAALCNCKMGVCIMIMLHKLLLNSAKFIRTMEQK